MSAALARPAMQSRRLPLKRLLGGPSTAMARGTARGDGTKRAVVALDGPTFDRVAMLAALSRVSFAEAVRQLLVLGVATHESEDGPCA